MYWFPFVRYKIETQKNFAQMEKQFICAVRLVDEFPSYKTKTFKDFDGIVTTNGFKIKKTNKEGNSSLSPIAYCRYSEYEKQSYIKVFIRFNHVLNVFLLYMLTLSIMLSFIDIMMLGLSILFFGVMMVFFNMEVKRLIEKTKEVFN